MTAATPPWVTTEELLAMPEDGMDRWLIGGVLREKPRTVHDRFHSRALVCVGTHLCTWLDAQPVPRGEVLAGEAGFRLRRDPDDTVGIDAAYVSADVMAQQSDEFTLIDGVPTLAVEIHSPSDTQGEIDEKTKTFLLAGVSLVWLLNPTDRTVKIYERGNPPRSVNESEELTAEPHLPGFRVPVAKLFG